MARNRITITLRDDLARLLDGTIDGQRVRNRSHAIELLLAQALVPKDTKVLILAGGKGVNFRPFTYETPKALIPVAGKPLLQHTIERLKQCNLTDVVISVGHLGEKVKQYFGDGGQWGMRISYLDQDQSHPGTAAPVKQAEKHFTTTFLLIYGDVLTDLNFLDLLDFHRSQRRTVATMALAPVERVSMWGLTKVVGNRITEFEEKPRSPKTRSHLINAGVYAIEPEIFQVIDKKAQRLEGDVFPRLAEEGRLAAYPFEGQWFDVSTPQIYERVIKEWRN